VNIKRFENAFLGYMHERDNIFNLNGTLKSKNNLIKKSVELSKI
jgi:hypothetical protein